jgi:hypothetical protein
MTCIVGLLVAGGCEVTRVMQPADDRAPAAGIEVDDQVSVRLRDGSRHDLTVTAIDERSLVGEDPAGVSHRIDWADVTLVEVRELDPVRTTVAMTGGAVLAAFAFGLLVLLTGAGAF